MSHNEVLKEEVGGGIGCAWCSTCVFAVAKVRVREEFALVPVVGLVRVNYPVVNCPSFCRTKLLLIATKNARAKVRRRRDARAEGSRVERIKNVSGCTPE